MPEPDNDMFNGQGKRYGVHDYELEIILQKIFETESCMSEMRSVIAYGKIAFCEDIEKKKNEECTFDELFYSIQNSLSIPQLISNQSDEDEE